MKLAAWMKAQALDDGAVAKMLKLSREAVRLLRLGKRKPSYRTMAATMKLTGAKVMPNDWFGGKG